MVKLRLVVEIFELFTNEYKELIDDEANRLLEKELSREDIKLKFKTDQPEFFKEIDSMIER